MIDVSTVKHTDAREVGAENVCLQAIRELQIDLFLRREGWNERRIHATLASLMVRTIYAPSEWKSLRIMEENSAAMELLTDHFGDMPTQREVYAAAPSLHALKDKLELCQNATFWCSPKGMSEWPRCKALRRRVKGVYWRTRTNPNADSNAADWPLWHIVFSSLWVTDMLMCDMDHIEKSSAAAFQGDKNPGIATEIRGIHMHDSFARHRGLFPFKTHCGQQTLDG